MKIVTTTCALAKRFSVEKVIEMISNAGFDAIDFDDCTIETAVWEEKYKDYAKHLRNVAESYGVSYSQTHAPIINTMLSGNKYSMECAIDRIKRSIEFSALLGAKFVVIHPIQDSKFATQAELVFERNMEYLSKLLPLAESCNITIAIENMVMAGPDGIHKRDGVCADPQEFKKYIDHFATNNITGCLDFGHSALAGRQPQDMLRTMGSDYIKCLHIHDNDFVTDSHQLPGLLKMDWNEICKAMAEIDYKGDFTLEAVLFYNNFFDDVIPSALRFMYEIAESMVKKIETYQHLN